MKRTEGRDDDPLKVKDYRSLKDKLEEGDYLLFRDGQKIILDRIAGINPFGASPFFSYGEVLTETNYLLKYSFARRHFLKEDVLVDLFENRVQQSKEILSIQKGQLGLLEKKKLKKQEEELERNNLEFVNFSS